MKRLFCLLIFAALTTASCVRSGDDTVKSQLVGEWNWVQSTGGFAGQTVTPDSPGHSPYSVTFTGDNHFYVQRGDTVASEGRYTLSITEDAAILHYEKSAKVANTDQRVRFNTSDTLLLMDECTDCYLSTYNRIN